MPSPTPPRATLDAVAQAAGVSRATASKVLNGRPSISLATRAKVQEAIDTLGYVPSTGVRAAGGLSKVLVVFRTLTDMYCVSLLDGILVSARDQNIEVIVETLDGPSSDRSPLSTAWMRYQAARKRSGVILVTTEVTDNQRDLMHQLGITTVHVDPVNTQDSNMVSVSATNYAGGVQATQHLLDLGHRRIAFAGGSPDSMPARERLQGYLATLSAAGIEPDNSLVSMTAYRFDAGVQMGQEFLSLPQPPTAIFAGADSTALGVLEAARRAGVRVPEDLSVVGFDDTHAATSSAPALTTIRQPITDIGRAALRALIEQAQGQRTQARHVQLSTELVVRHSTAAPAAA